MTGLPLLQKCQAVPSAHVGLIPYQLTVLTVVCVPVLLQS